MIAGIAVRPDEQGLADQPAEGAAGGLPQRRRVLDARPASALTCSTCRIPTIASTIATLPAIRRGRCCGSGVDAHQHARRCRRGASGTSTASEPTQTRTASSATPPTGPAACSQVPIAQTSATAISPSAMPSRRCRASMSRVDRAPRPIALTSPPSQRATTVHAPRMPWPMPTTSPRDPAGPAPLEPDRPPAVDRAGWTSTSWWSSRDPRIPAATRGAPGRGTRGAGGVRARPLPAPAAGAGGGRGRLAGHDVTLTARVPWFPSATPGGAAQSAAGACSGRCRR